MNNGNVGTNDLELELVKWITEKELNGVKQHSADWHTLRVNTIGGSTLAVIQGVNPYSSVQQLLCEKIGYSQFHGDIKTQWGNLFEDVIKRVVEHDKSCIVHGEDLYVLGQDGISYSPDGLAVITHPNGQKCITLLEFKCPYSRIPSGKVPKYYIPQVKMGMEVLKIPTIGLFVEGVFRRCSWDDIGYNNRCDTSLVKVSGGDLPKAYGIIGLYIDKAATTHCVEKLLSQYLLYQDEVGDGSNDYMNNDLGESQVALFTALINALDKKIIASWYGSISYTAEEIHLVYQDSDNYIEFCRAHDYINLGILPWKLFRLDYNYISKEENYLQPWMGKILELIDVIKKCNDPLNVDKKYNIYASYCEKNLSK